MFTKVGKNNVCLKALYEAINNEGLQYQQINGRKAMIPATTKEPYLNQWSANRKMQTIIWINLSYQICKEIT